MTHYPIATKWENLYTPPNKKSVVLFSGGFESSTVVAWLKAHEVPVFALHVQYGHKGQIAELQAAETWADRYRVPLTVFPCALGFLYPCAIIQGQPDNPDPTDSDPYVLEFRNVALLSLAVTFAAGIGAHHVYVGFNHEPDHRPYPDSTIECWKTFQAMCDVSLREPITIHAPFAGLRRVDILRGALSIDPEIVDIVFSCHEGATEPCGRCEHCKTREAMLAQLRDEGVLV